MEPIWYIIFMLAFLMIFITLIFGTLSRKKVNKVFDRYRKIKAQCDLNVNEFATILISKADLEVEVVEINSKTSNCYSSKYKVLKFSKEMLNSISLISLSKCAQEVGYAIQDKNKNFSFRIKTALFPIIKVLNSLFFPLIFIGFLLRFTFNFPLVGLYFAITGIILLIISILFYLSTFSVENKSSELISEIIDKCDFLTDDEIYALKDLIYVNASIYIANLTTSLLFFLNFFSIPEIKNNAA